MKKFYFFIGVLLLVFVLGKSSPSSNTAGISTENKPQPTNRIIEIIPTQDIPQITSDFSTAEPIITPTLIPTLTLIPTEFIPTQIPPTKYITLTTAQIDNGLSNDDYYINVDGNKVHSPVHSDTAPQGATAKCKDGTYSFSQHRRGTCSGHDGVAEWL